MTTAEKAVVFFQKKLPPHMATDVEKWGGSLGLVLMKAVSKYDN